MNKSITKSPESIERGRDRCEKGGIFPTFSIIHKKLFVYERKNCSEAANNIRGQNRS